MWKKLVFTLILTTWSTCKGQNFAPYENVTSFTCDDISVLERIYLTSECGEIISPCYPDNYPKEVENGPKLWEINAGGAGVPAPVFAYRLTLNVFETNDPGGNLDFSATLFPKPVSTASYIPASDRNITITGKASVDPGAKLEIGGTEIRRRQGEFIEIALPFLFASFYSSRADTDRGFNITYCADYDKCDPSFTPVLCNDSLSQCRRHGFNNYTCDCKDGYTGENCTTDIDECALSGSCAPNSNCTNSFGNYTCTCNEGYSGDGFTTCVDIDECGLGTDDCHDNATCTNIGSGFTCTCNSGFTGSGTFCEDIDECDEGSDDCHSNATCTNNVGSYICACKTGFNGNGTSCSDIDECIENTDDCHPNATCTNNDGSYVCACSTGFSGNGTFCADIDECILNTDDCADTADCLNTEGSFTCECDSGFEGDGKSCTDIDECAPGGSNNCDPTLANCTNSLGSFTCTCDKGYSGNGVSCTNIDECADPDACHVNATCSDNPGSFVCTCNAGYTGNGLTCEEIDECAGIDICHVNASCVNLVGSFACNCNKGYSGDGSNCTDNDECTLDADDCHENADCTNTGGSFRCTCKSGYTGNGTFCADIDECDLGTDDCAIEPRAFCNNTEGSFTCACNAGWSGSGKTCTDIDECAENVDNCHPNATCSNNMGSFSCSCKTPGFSGDGETCTNIDECATTPCDGNATCLDNLGSFDCNCNPGYMGDGFTCAEIDECSATPSPCHVNATCRNEPVGSFTCTCNLGFAGDGITCTDIDECTVGTDTCNTILNERCENTIGSFTCDCNFPEYRGIPPNCEGYYCPGTVDTRFDTGPTICTIPGIIEWPTFWDGTITYELDQTVSWFVNLTGQTSSPAIRFSFRRLSVERKEDYIIFSNSMDSREEPRLAVFTGELDSVFNGENQADSTNPENYDDIAKTFLVESSEIYIHFISDRRDVFSGFQIQYEPDGDDCPDPSPCANGGTCSDRAFTYTCINCPGYTGQNCSIDEDECTLGTDNCDTNAICTNIDGGFTCDCRSAYAGNGTSCRPLIELSNLVAIPTSDATTSSLSVNFNLTQMWATNPDYVVNYIVRITNTGNGIPMDFTTPSVTSTNFLPLVIPVMGFTTYTVEVLVGATGSLYTTAVFRYASGSESINVTSGSLAPGIPSSLTIVEQNEISVTVNWTAPVETGVGQVTQYELEYVRNETDCALYEILGPQVDCGVPKTVTKPLVIGPTFTIDGLELYRTYRFRVRAYSVTGISAWSASVLAFTGTPCPSHPDKATAQANRCTRSRGSLSSDSFPNPYANFDRQYWEIDYSGQGAIKIDFDYFFLQEEQDPLDIGQGEIPDEPITITNSKFEEFSGNLSNRESLIYNENSTNMGLIYFRFSPDLFVSTAGFQLHYQTNASQCVPNNPCKNGGTCTPLLFNFTCECTSLWTGDVCNDPLVEITASCSSTSPDSFTVSWSVSPMWENDDAVISGYTISYSNNSVTREIGTSSYTASGFTPYQPVQVQVVVNAVDPGTTTTNAAFECRTAQAPPGKPASLNVNVPANDNTVVTWEPPSMPNGVITSYTITYTQTDGATYGETADSGIATATASETSATFTTLRAFRNYTLTVTANNIAGTGEAESFDFTNAESVPETSVGNLTVTVAIRSATFEFLAPTLITGVFSYDVVYLEAGVTETYTGIASPLTVPDLTPFTSYDFTIYCKTSAGRGPGLSRSITTLGGIPGDVSNFGLDPETSTSIRAFWQTPTSPNGVITRYRVVWIPTAGGTEMSRDVGTDTSFNITSLSAYTTYTVTLFASTTAGENIGTSRSARTQASAPQGSVQNVTVPAAAVQANNVTLNIVAPAIVTGVFTYNIACIPTVTANGVSAPHVLTTLTAFTSYNCTIYPVSASQIGTVPFIFNFMTAEDIPGPVGNLAVSGTTAVNVTLSWDVPAMPNGLITAYRIAWTPATGLGGGAATSTTFTASGLTAYTNYDVEVFASTSVGEGPGVSVSERTAEAAPTAVTNLAAAVNTDNTISVSFDPPALANGILLFYTIRVEQNADNCLLYNESCQSFLEYLDFPSGDTSYTSPVLSYYRDFTVTVYANTSAGNGPSLSQSLQTNIGVPGTPQAEPPVAMDNTSVSVTWSAPVPITGPITYTVTLVPASGDTVVRTVVNSTRATESISVTGLQPGVSYSITVSASTSAGSGGRSPVVTLYKSPDTAPGATIPQPIGDNLQGASQFTAMSIENPCLIKTTLFSTQGGEVTSIDVIVKEQGADANAVPGFWSTSIDMTPIPPYHTSTIQCPITLSRRKRQLSTDGRIFTIGSNTSCSRSGDTVCNGPLQPDRSYQVAYRGTNAGGRSGVTGFGTPYTLPSQASNRPSLQAGEIAAIVICSVIVFLLLIALIVFLVRRRRHGMSPTAKQRTDDTYSEVRKPKSLYKTTSADAPPETSYSQQTEKD